jgi:hypothetical protein
MSYMPSSNDLNHAALRQLKPRIDQAYPRGQYVAINGGQIIANDSDVRHLIQDLQAKGMNPQEVLVVQAGQDYPERADILQAV